MKTEKTANPLANLNASDLKIVKAMCDANTKATKASEALTRAIGEAYNQGLHTKAGWSNFGKWFVAACGANGVVVSKSRAYNAVKCADVRNIAPEANNLPDTVVVRIAESAPLGDAEKTAAFVAEVVKAGGTVESVRTLTNGKNPPKDPADALAEMISERLWKTCRGDVKGAEAVLSHAISLYREHAIAQATAK